MSEIVHTLALDAKAPKRTASEAREAAAAPSADGSIGGGRPLMATVESSQIVSAYTSRMRPLARSRIPGQFERISPVAQTIKNARRIGNGKESPE